MLKFDEKLHLYTLDDKPITGVTTILKTISKPQLIQWSANMAVEYIEKEVAKIGLESISDKWEEILKQAKTAHTRKANKAAGTGTAAHSWCEQYINAKIKGEKEPERDESLALMTDNFVKWAEEGKVKFISAEQRVFSREKWFAGTYDFDCEIDGKLYLGDLKTSSAIYPEMLLQCAGYRIAVEEMNRPDIVPFDGSIVVNCKKDGKMDWIISKDYEKEKKAFLSALDIYRYISTYQVTDKE